jgi:hypothetical protein
VIAMSPADEVARLLAKTNGDLDEWSDFLEHTKAVWRGFEFWVTLGNTFRARNAATGREFTEADLIGLSQLYIAEHLAKFIFQRYISVFEVFLFGVLQILLTNSPGHLSKKTYTLGEILGKRTIAEIVVEAVEKELNEKRYAKPKDWFQFLNTICKLGCPNDDEIERIAEIKATRDVIEHNSGLVNQTYLLKSGSKARYVEGQ